MVRYKLPSKKIADCIHKSGSPLLLLCSAALRLSSCLFGNSAVGCGIDCCMNAPWRMDTMPFEKNTKYEENVTMRSLLNYQAYSNSESLFKEAVKSS